jgi:mRNA-degrading endonuclease toxin of MazEF toxin-antitoxin module
MAYRKTAIAVPEQLLADVDRAAHARGESRSAYISRVLAVAVRAPRDAEITRKLDELFATSASGRRGSPAKRRSDLKRPSVVNVTQLRTIDRDRLTEKIGSLAPARLRRVLEGLALVLGLDPLVR